jgi:hypothetical protein
MFQRQADKKFLAQKVYMAKFGVSSPAGHLSNFSVADHPSGTHYRAMS